MTVKVETTAGERVFKSAVKAKVVGGDGNKPPRLCLYEETDDLINHPVKEFNYNFVISHEVFYGG